MGLQDAKARIDRMIGLDYLIANTDRHHGNFGLIREADTLKWLKIAPIFDSGTSLWCDKANVSNITAERRTASRAFMNTNEEQISLIHDCHWFDVLKLDKVPAMAMDILSMNSDIEKERIEKICSSLEQRIEMFQNIARGRKPERYPPKPTKKTPGDYDIER
jgi:hypothetical protein